MKRAFAGSMIFLVGCSVGPKYQPPQVKTPVSYKEAPAPERTKDWKPAEPQDEADRLNWWKIFNNSELNSLAERVQVSNESLKAAEARFRQARAMIQANRSARFPSVVTGMGVGGLRFSGNRPGFPSTLRAEDSANLTLPTDMSYELDLWGRIRKTIEASQAQAQASMADIHAARLFLQSELAIHYFEMCAASEQQRVLRNTVSAFEDALRLTRNRFEGGVTSRNDVAQAEAQLESARADLSEIDSLRAQSEHAIAVLIGLAPAELTVTANGENVLNPPEVPIGLPSELLERRPDIAAMERRASAANREIGIAQTAFYPTVRFGASFGLTGTSMLNWFNWPSRFWSVGPTATLPIFDAGRRKALTESAMAAYDATVAEYRQTALSAFQEVEDHLAILKALETTLQQQQKAVNAARESLQLAMNRYQGGVDTYLQVLNAQTIVLNAERRIIDIQRQRMISTVSLVKALGGGWETSDLPTFAKK